MVSKFSHYTASWSRKKWFWGRLISQATQGCIDKSSTMCICAKSDTGQSHTFYLDKKKQCLVFPAHQGEERRPFPQETRVCPRKTGEPGVKGRFHWNAAHTGAQCRCRDSYMSASVRGRGEEGRNLGKVLNNPLNRVICQIGKAVNCPLRTKCYRGTEFSLRSSKQRLWSQVWTKLMSE